MLRRNFLGALGGLFIAAGLRFSEPELEKSKTIKAPKCHRGEPYKIECGTVISKGDLLWMSDDGYIRPASAFKWDTDLPTAQSEFSKRFIGVSDDIGSMTFSTDFVFEVKV